LVGETCGVRGLCLSLNGAGLRSPLEAFDPFLPKHVTVTPALY